MPAVFLDRLPLPSLQAYTVISVLLLSCSVYYAFQVTSNPEWKLNSTADMTGSFAVASPGTSGERDGDGVPSFKVETMNVGNSSVADLLGETSLTMDHSVLNNVVFRRFAEVVYFMIQEPLCIWTLVNMAYCCLILVGKVIQKLVFGELRVSEQQHIKDKFWNFVFYKFIFIFGVMNVQFMDEVVLWCSWFSVLGFLHLLVQLCKDRFEYLSFSPTTPKWTHVRLLALLFGILSIALSLFAICVLVGLHAGINTFAFMAAECALVTIRTLYVIARYAVHLWDINHEGVWENRATYVYYTELVFELIALAIDFFHHLHMLLWGNIFLSMASLVICMQLRYLFYEAQRRLKKHKNYLRVVRHMETNYTMATTDELEKNSDDCAICWDRMEAARKLPCGHLFHNSCLRSWLEQDTSCPTCRMALSDHAESDLNANTEDDNRNNILGTLGGQDAAQGRPVNQTMNHFFHFDGSRYVSWLPSFSVEVTHTNLLGERHLPPIQTSQLDNMARQVQQMFPHMPLNVIVDDLRMTRSVEITIENILDERLIPPPSALFNGSAPRENLPSSIDTVPQEDKATKKVKKDNLEGRLLPNVTTCEDAHIRESEASDMEAESNSNPGLGLRPRGLGFRFSKSPRERERMLARRKEELIDMARKKYVSSKLHTSSDSESDSSASEDCHTDAFSMPSSSSEVFQDARRTLSYVTARHRLVGRQDT